MTVSVGEIIRVSARFKSTVSGDIVNVYHWKCGGTGSDTDENVMDAIDSKLSAMWAHIATNVVNSCVPYDIRYDVVEMVGGVERVVRTLGTRSWTLTTPPSSSAEGLPSMDAAIVNFRTTIPRTYGRKYIGAMTETGQSNGSLGAGQTANLASWATEYLTTFTVGTLVLAAGVLTNDSAAVANWADATAAVVNAILGTQRRRRISRGS